MNGLSKLCTCALIVVTTLVSSGCGVKLAYNNGDRLVRWWVDDYIDMTGEQRTYLNAATNDLLYWHRTNELEGYRQVFLQLADNAYNPQLQTQQPLTAPQLQELIAQFEDWGMRIGERAIPIAVQMLLSLSSAQLEEFAANLEEENVEYLEEAQQDPEERAQEMAKDYRKFVSRLVGRLTTQQRQLVLDHHARLVIFEMETVAFRRQWLRQVEAAVSAQPPAREKLAELLWLDEEDYPEEFQAVFERNEEVYQGLTLDLLNSLNTKQRKRFQQRLRTLAKICQELIDEAGNPPVAPQPLVPEPD